MTATPSINSLPYEVRHTIYSLLGRQTDSHRWIGGSTVSIAHYAAVSREWQEAFERFTFRELLVTPKRLKPFTHIVTSPRRRAIVQTICFHVSLDKYERYLDREQETSAERRRSTEILTTALEAFFRAMTYWDKTETSPLGLWFYLLVDSPSESMLFGRNGTPMVTERALTSDLKLDLEMLSLPYIDVFSGFRCAGRHLQPTSLLAIVSRLRTLEYLDVELNHDSIRHRDVTQRNKFASSLETCAQTVRVLSLRRPSPMLTLSSAPPQQPWAAFYTHIRTFSQQCESFEFDDCIDASQFFAPFLVGSPRIQETPFWIRLKRLNVRNSYMMKSPYLRVANRIEALASVHGVFLAIGRAACRMPELQFARICQYVLTDGRLEWFVLTYECLVGKAVLRARGFVPGKAMLDAWKRSIAEKGLEYDVHVEVIDPTAPEL
ncbi:hypothetical protein F4677DRAFT_158922 [Hypoxylon crocopeplum]|nr:hypothetical protein F4677DRAFT_158922 [Hypoxylon crocopeplum]